VLYFEALDCNTREFQFKQQFFEICRVKNIHLFRMLDSIRNDAGQMIQGGIEKGYQDKYHLRPATAHRAGQEYARVLQAAYSARAPGKNGVENFIHAIDHQTFDKTGLDLRCGKISNRLVDFVTIQVDANGIQLPIQPDLEGHEMIGILFNATSSNGLLEMVGQDKLIKNFSSSSRKYWKKDLVWARPLRKKILLGCELHLRALSGATPFEETQFCQTSEFDDARAPMVEVVGFCVLAAGCLAPFGKILNQIFQSLPSNTEKPSVQAQKELVALFAAGQYPAAADAAKTMAARFPNHGFAWKVYGAALKQMGRKYEPLEPLLIAAGLSPKDAEVHNNLGAIFHDMGRHDDAAISYRQALEINPGYGEAHCNLGNTLQALGRQDAARQHFEFALKSKPGYAQAHCGLGMVLQIQGDAKAAENHFRLALNIWPDYPQAHCNLGGLLQQQDQFNAAIAHFRRAIVLWPGFAEAHSNLGNTLRIVNQLDESAAHCRTALQLEPQFAEAHCNLGTVLDALGSHEAAESHFRKALALKSDYPDARMNLGCWLLRSGQFMEGWALYEARQRQNNHQCQLTAPKVAFPQWQGENLAGKSLLVQGEQGLGDQIQFCRYLTVLKNQGIRHITLVCSPPLKSVFSRLSAADAVVGFNEAGQLPVHDFWIYLASLPFYFRATLKNIPDTVSYLTADTDLQQALAQSLVAVSDFKVGLCWNGSRRYPWDALRSPGLQAFEKLFGLTGVRFASLQVGSRDAFLLAAGPTAMDLGHDIDVHTAPFEETAALIMNVDLVITCDTAIGHLAGALGKPVWVVLPYHADWRWMLDRDDSVWYANTRLFRQTTRGDWDEVFERVSVRLTAMIAGDDLAVWRVAGGLVPNLPPVKATKQAVMAPISVGELFDKITILELKLDRLAEAEKRLNVYKELTLLQAIAARSMALDAQGGDIVKELKVVNGLLWEVQDALRTCERQNDFGRRFIELACAVYRHNDQRTLLKQKLNHLTQSEIKEEKLYAPYQE